MRRRNSAVSCLQIKAQKNPKKTWELLREATVGTKPNKKIDKIVVNGEQISDPPRIADAFNEFFTSVGSKISESVRPTDVDPISLMPDLPHLNNLVLTNIGPNRLCEIIKTFESKSSCDLDGISTKLLKHVISDLLWIPIYNYSYRKFIYVSILKPRR